MEQIRRPQILSSAPIWSPNPEPKEIGLQTTVLLKTGGTSRLKSFRRIFSRLEKLDVMFLGFLNFVLVVHGLSDLC